jgi:hypothetical protein
VSSELFVKQICEGNQMLAALGGNPNVYATSVVVADEGKVTLHVWNEAGTRMYQGSLADLEGFMDVLRNTAARAEAIAIHAKGQ